MHSSTRSRRTERRVAARSCSPGYHLRSPWEKCPGTAAESATRRSRRIRRGSPPAARAPFRRRPFAPFAPAPRPFRALRAARPHSAPSPSARCRPASRCALRMLVSRLLLKWSRSPHPSSSSSSAPAPPAPPPPPPICRPRPPGPPGGSLPPAFLALRLPRHSPRRSLPLPPPGRTPAGGARPPLL